MSKNKKKLPDTVGKKGPSDYQNSKTMVDKTESVTKAGKKK